ncbi:MAG: amino acid adenylation domain-containing protein [Candidatus Omnitrophota bacterium]
MSIVNFLYELKKLGISVQLEDRNLKVKMVSGKIPPEIVAQLKERKEEIIHFLKMGAMSGKYVEIQPVEEREYYPLSSAQKRLYFVQQMNPNSVAYNITYLAPLGKEMTPDRLKSVLMRLITRHESLRTSFEIIGETPIQRIHESVEIHIDYHDFIDKPANNAAIESLSRSFSRPFDLSKAPLLHSMLIRLPDGNHRWMVDIHHIVSDGTSMRILTDEFLTLYRGGQLNPLRLQYKDFSSWQNQCFEDEKIKDLEAYWLGIFQGDIPRLNIPLDSPRPGIFTFQGNCHNFKLEGETATRFKALAQAHGGTLYMNILAVLNTIFYRYTGQTDMIIGTGIAGRPHADLQQIIGMFINALAIRNRPEGHKSYESFLKEVIETSIRAFEHQDLQFETLVEKLTIERDPSRNPLFDIMVTVQNFGGGGKQNGDAINVNETLDDVKMTTKFDMTFSVDEKGSDILIGLDYYTAIFKRETIVRFVDHFKKIVNAVIADPSITLDAIDLMGEGEREDILFRFNGPATEYPKDKTIHELFDAQVQEMPDHVALLGPTAVGALREAPPQMSYRELNDRANRLANELIRKGVEPDTIVAIKVERSMEMVIGVLGILKAGAAYLPIDPSYPEERVDYMLKDSGAALLVTTDNEEVKKLRSWEVKEELSLDHLILLTSHPLIFSSSTPATGNRQPATSLAYIIYTSGSTGRPKGVMVAHRHVVRLVKSDFISYSSQDRLLLTGAVGFDITTFEIWSPLLNGVMLALTSKEIILDAARLKNVLIHHRISVLHLIPQLFNRLAEQDLGLFAGLRYFLVGGDSVNPKYINQLRQIYRDLTILHMYGPTENTTFSTVFDVDREYHERIPIGKPISNSTAIVVNPNGLLQPIGIAGELWVGGDGIARGYLNNPELTFERFTGSRLPVSGFLNRTHSHNKHNHTKSFCPAFYKKRAAGGNTYKTGDLARLLEDGNLEFLGRIDHQVKIRGFRIELGEIESCLVRHAAISAAVVIAKTDKNKENYLCAYLVSDKKWQISELKEYLLTSLPDYMIPSHVVQMDRIPLTPNGKIDKKALPEPDLQSVGYVAPRNEIEEKLAEIWSAILGIENEQIGIDDNFFDVGGHSLKATSLVAHIFKEMNVKITLPDIFRTPTIRGLSQHMMGAVRTLSDLSDAIQPVEKKEYYSPSPVQKRLVALQRSKPETIVYNIPFVLELEGDLDITKVTWVLQQLAARHEGFRTYFRYVGEEIIMGIHDEIDFKIEYHDGYSTDAAKATPEQIVRQFVRPFVMACAPLVRVGLIKTSENAHILMLDSHHIINDGSSQVLLMKEFVDLYIGNELKPLMIQHKDYTHWHLGNRNGARIQTLETYWFDRFNGNVPALELPYDYPPPLEKNYHGDRMSFVLEPQHTGPLRQLSDACGATLFMLLLTLFNMLMAKLSGQNDIIVGAPTAGRTHADLENIFGLFVSSLALRHYPTGEKTFMAFLNEVKTRTTADFEHQDYPVEELLKKVNETREKKLGHLYNVMLVLENIERPMGNIPGLTLKRFPFNINVAKYDLVLIGSEHQGYLYYTFEYSTQLFKKETILRIASDFNDIILSVIKNPNQPLSEII